jgi:HEAT repeat protein
MKLRIRRKHVLTALLLLLGAGFITWELFQLSPAVRRAYVRLAADCEAYDSISRLLADSDPSVFREAIRRLKEAGAASVPALTRRLGDSGEITRRLAAMILGMIGPSARESLPALMDRIQTDDNEIVRSNCAKAFGQIGRDDPALLDELIGMLQIGDEHIRPHAAEALGLIGGDSKRVLAVLESALKHDLQPRVREEAAEAIGSLGPAATPAVAALLDAMKNDPDKGVRREAAEALKELVKNRAIADPKLKAEIQNTVRQAAKSGRPR